MAVCVGLCGARVWQSGDTIWAASSEASWMSSGEMSFDDYVGRSVCLGKFLGNKRELGPDD